MNQLPAYPRSSRTLPSFDDRESAIVHILTSGRAFGFVAHLIAYVFTCLIVLVTAGLFPTLIVALSWGIGLGLHGFFALLVPILRLVRRDALAPEVELEQGTPPYAAERARSLEELSAAIAHEIRNPITAAKSLVQQIAEDPAAAENGEHARVAVEELDRVERSIAHLLRFAREEPFEPRAIDVRELIESAVELLRDRAERQGVRIERDIERLPQLIADGEQLRKVLANLIGNALDAHAAHPHEGAWIRLSAGRNLAGDELWMRVTDNGPGLSELEQKHAFAPFRSTKPGGTGLGLALARKVLARHGGSIELVQTQRPGAEFLLVLPLRARLTESGR